MVSEIKPFEEGWDGYNTNGNKLHHQIIGF